MSKKNIASLARAVLMIGGTFAVTKGYISEAGLNDIIGYGSALGGVIWGQIAANKARKVEQVEGLK